MTPEDAVSEYRRVIAEYDARYGEDPLEKRQRQREAKQQERRAQEVKKIEHQALTDAQWDQWFEAKFMASQARNALTDAIGETQAILRKELRKDYETKFAAQEARIKQLETELSVEHKFAELEHQLDARQLARDEAKRGSEMIPQSELLARIDRLERQRDDPKRIADLDARFRELAERVSALEKTNAIDARFTELAHGVKHGSQIIQQSELLEKVEKLQRQLDDPNRVADLDVPFRELTERVGELEKTNSLEARFAKLVHEVKRGSEIPQSELQGKFEALERRLDELVGVADQDARFRELTERVTGLEKTNSLEQRFNKLTDEVKHGSEVPQHQLLTRIDRLERQLDDLKRIPGQSGPQGPPGKLPCVKEYAAGRVHYEADVVTHADALWQARGDTVHAPPHSDWICLARAGRNGSDGRSPNVCGTYDARERYERLDIVALDDAAFIARRDNPGVCPGDGWQLLSRQGRPGHRGETGERGVRGEKGERGEPGATVVSWQLDRLRYRISPLMSDGKVGPMLELRGLFEQFLSETS
jgi:hypothetical protein